MLPALVTPIGLSLRRMPTQTVGIQTFIVSTLQRLEFLFNFYNHTGTKTQKGTKTFVLLSAFVALK